MERIQVHRRLVWCVEKVVEAMAEHEQFSEKTDEAVCEKREDDDEREEICSYCFREPFLDSPLKIEALV
jgi:hypothetical protein